MYCNSLVNFSKVNTVEIHVGNIAIGGNNEIRIQSMTNTNTLNTEATAEQSIRIFEAGGEIVRITAPGIKEAENLQNIKQYILKKGFTFPLVADIHFNPKAALIAAQNVEKVRINPGNFAERPIGKSEYTKEEFDKGVENIRKEFTALLNLCKENKTALRIGINHGSLSERIMSKYGDTINGMVESAMEYLRVCLKENFKNVVLSIKSSNTQVMVQAYRSLALQMKKENMNFPLHLGVTEAGDAEDGRIKSAVGIGALLADGLGDTIRVSLTEDPEKEIPIAKILAEKFQNRENTTTFTEPKTIPYNPYEFKRRLSTSVKNIGNNFPPIVVSNNECSSNQLLPDYILSKNTDVDFVEIEVDSIKNFKELKSYSANTVFIAKTNNRNYTGSIRNFFFKLAENSILNPVILKYTDNSLIKDEFIVNSAADLGSILIDGFGDGILLESTELPNEFVIQTAFGILQACRLRFSKTDYIMCPSCGRTLFDIQKVAAKIKERTNHLKNLKIAVMGCIVNGPGEMADADYGYIGSGNNKVNLYKKKQLVKKGVPEENAVNELINLIKENGDWVNVSSI